MARTLSGGPRGRNVKLVRLAHNADLPLPAYQTADAAGLDLVAAVPGGKPLRLKKGARVLVPTGLVIELPKGYEAQIRPRSGLALKHGITVLNAPGTIDADYRGEVQVLLVNLGEGTFSIARGDRIAQMIIAPVSRAVLVEAKTARATERGAGGFGSTGATTTAAKGAAAVKAGKAVKAAASRGKAQTKARKKASAASFPRRSLKSPRRR
ncbi:MAG TPA: dUTP diphosphatase [Hyphomicrobiaceae bacterium]|nr:dUTP diphosphatase [Hyphomicrobiaceae bacterium]